MPMTASIATQSAMDMAAMTAATIKAANTKSDGIAAEITQITDR